MKVAITLTMLMGVVALGIHASLPTDCLAESGEVHVMPNVGSVDDAGAMLAARLVAAENALFFRLWQWKPIIILAPTACGMSILILHVLFRISRWCCRKPSADTDCGQESFRVKNEAPSPFIIRLVEREHRRAIERAEARQVRPFVVVADDHDDKEDIPRAA